MASLVERMRARAAQATESEISWQDNQSGTDTRVCPDCGAGRSEAHGVAECRYCGHVFIDRLAGPSARRDP